MDKENEGYTFVGTGGKVKWEFLITSKTTNEEIEKVLTTKLLSAVSKVEKTIRNLNSNRKGFTWTQRSISSGQRCTGQ